MKDFNLEKRKYVVAGSVVFIVLAYILRLFTLQIVSDDYKQSADSNAFLNQIQFFVFLCLYNNCFHFVRILQFPTKYRLFLL